MKQERQDINQRLKPFARFMTSTEYENLLKGLLKTKNGIIYYISINGVFTSN